MDSLLQLFAAFSILKWGEKNAVKVWTLYVVTIAGWATTNVFFSDQFGHKLAEWVGWLWVILFWLATLLRIKTKQRDMKTWKCPYCEARNLNASILCRKCGAGLLG
jgi:hypothetical protein